MAKSGPPKIGWGKPAQDPPKPDKFRDPQPEPDPRDHPPRHPGEPDYR